MSPKATNSNVKDLKFDMRLREWCQHFSRYFNDLFKSDISNRIWRDFSEYEGYLSKFGRGSLKDAAVFEIGYGARPYRLLTLISMGVNAKGVDMDAPVLQGTWGEFKEIWGKNGTERLIKSFVRHFVFDWKSRRELRRFLCAKGYSFVIPSFGNPNFIVADASSNIMGQYIPPQSLDLVFSEDVFEHIPANNLSSLLRNLATWLKPEGLALIRPNIFTGITGGHLAEWYPDTIMRKMPRRKSEPWEHLRKNRFRANTFLNELSRNDYREIFSRDFYILEEKVSQPELGIQFLTEEAQKELNHFPLDELFSNQIMFVLRPKS